MTVSGSMVLSVGVIVCNQWLYPTVSWGLVVILILVYANAVIRLAITGRSPIGAVTPEKLNLPDATVSNEDFQALQHRPLS